MLAGRAPARLKPSRVRRAAPPRGARPRPVAVCGSSAAAGCALKYFHYGPESPQDSGVRTQERDCPPFRAACARPARRPGVVGAFVGGGGARTSRAPPRAALYSGHEKAVRPAPSSAPYAAWYMYADTILGAVTLFMVHNGMGLLRCSRS